MIIALTLLTKARTIIDKYFDSIGDENIMFTKTDLSSMGSKPRSKDVLLKDN